MARVTDRDSCVKGRRSYGGRPPSSLTNSIIPAHSVERFVYDEIPKFGFLPVVFISLLVDLGPREIKISGHEDRSAPRPLFPLLAAAAVRCAELQRCELLRWHELRDLQHPLRPQRHAPLDLPRVQRHRRRCVPSAAVLQRVGRLGHQPRWRRHGRRQRVPCLPLRRLRHGLHDPVHQHRSPAVGGHQREPRLHGAQPEGGVLLFRRVLHHLRLAGSPWEPDDAEHGVAGVHFVQRRRTVQPPDYGRQRHIDGVGEFSVRPVVFRRRDTEDPPEEHSWRGECDQLGNSPPHRSHHSEVPEGVQVRRSRLVLPPRRLPVLRLHHRPFRLDYRPPARQRLQGDHIPQAPEPRHRHLHPRYLAGVRLVPEAEQGSQVQTPLEHLPLRDWIRRHRHEHRQHLRGLRHPGPREEVEDRLHRHHRHPRRRRACAGSRHLAHRHHEEEQGRQGWPCRPWRKRLRLKPKLHQLHARCRHTI